MTFNHFSLVYCTVCVVIVGAERPDTPDFTRPPHASFLPQPDVLDAAETATLQARH